MNRFVLLALAMLCLVQVGLSTKDSDDFVMGSFMKDLNELSDEELDNFQELLLNWMNKNLNEKTSETCQACFQVRVVDSVDSSNT